MRLLFCSQQADILYILKCILEADILVAKKQNLPLKTQKAIISRKNDDCIKKKCCFLLLDFSAALFRIILLGI